MITILLWILFPIGIQYERGGWWWLLFPFFTIPTYILDVLANYTELALVFWDYPKKGEYTFSKRLERLRKGEERKNKLASYIANILNDISPRGDHIK